MKTLDPVALREGKERASKRLRVSKDLVLATDALLWLHDYATIGEGSGPREVKPSALVGENGFGGRKLPT